jgi:amidase
MKINRRTAIAASAAGLGLMACTGKTSETTAAPKEAKQMDLTDQIASLKNGDIKASEMLEQTIERIDILNPKVNAVLTTCYDRARDFVKDLPTGTFAGGVPMLIKDLKDVSGVQSTYGIGAFKGYIPQTSDIYVQRVEKAGMAVVGKTNTPELGLLPVTEPNAYIASRNPWDLSKTTGGSSGGTAAAVASGMMPCAQGSDGGGSIRIPAHYNGLFGLKPSRHRVVGAKKRPFSISVSGALSKTVRDSALMMSLTETADQDRDFPAIGMVRTAIDRPLKIGLAMTDYFFGENIADAEVNAAIASTAKLCESLGHDIVETTVPVLGQPLRDAFLMLWASIPYETIKGVERMKGGPINDQDFEPWTQEMAAHYERNGGEEGLAKAIVLLKQGEQQIVDYLNGFDVLLSPIMPTAAHGLGRYDTSDRDGYEAGLQMASDTVGYSAVYNVAGACAMSVPLFRSPFGLPIGSQFISAPGNDGLLLQLAYQLEEAQPWIESYPDLLG